MPPALVLPEDPLCELPPSSFVLALCVWNGYADVGQMIVCARAYYTDPDFLASEYGLARHVSNIAGDKPRTRLQHASGDLNHERGLARVQQFLNAPGVKNQNLTPNQLINVGIDNEETPLARAVQCGNIPLIRLLSQHGAVCSDEMITRAIHIDRDVAVTLIDLVGIARSTAILDDLELKFSRDVSMFSTVWGKPLPIDNVDGDEYAAKLIKMREFIRHLRPGLIKQFEEFGYLEKIGA
jgi:hypothetical protein